MNEALRSPWLRLLLAVTGAALSVFWSDLRQAYLASAFYGRAE